MEILRAFLMFSLGFAFLSVGVTGFATYRYLQRPHIEYIIKPVQIDCPILPSVATSSDPLLNIPATTSTTTVM